jgi:hypothetical protein
VTIQDWGSIGELIAAVATVLTLIYLALQIRANTAAVKAESRRREVDTAAPYATSIVENPDVARVFLAGLAGEPGLSPEDFTRFAFLMGQLVGVEAAFFDEVQLGVGSADRLEDRERQLVRFLSTAGGRKWWKQFGHNYGRGFRAHIQSRIDDSEGAA